MMLDDWIRRADELIGLGADVLKSKHTSDGYTHYVDELGFAEFRSSSLSFLRNVYGDGHPFYTDFNSNVSAARPDDTRNGIGILRGARNELTGGWLRTAKGLVSAEIFTDFLDMAEHLLSESYKDAAAVMVGSVLEEHLRQLCGKFGIAVSDVKGGKPVPKKADTLNAELTKASAYNMLDQKQVTAWLDLRNKAAHGHYGEYAAEQVRGMLDGVTNFMARVTT